MDAVSTRDMCSNQRTFDLNEYPVEDISSVNDYSETIGQHFDHNVLTKDVLEVDKIGASEDDCLEIVEHIKSFEEANLVPSSQNIGMNDFLEVDKDRNSKETTIVPFVGQIFLSEEEAFGFYKRYAYQHGFSIRKGKFIKQNGIMSRRDFFCHCEGRVSLKIIEPSKEQTKRESSKCECKAHLRISLQKSYDILPSEWRVTKFVAEHNHVLLTQSEVRFLPANRTIS